MPHRHFHPCHRGSLRCLLPTSSADSRLTGGRFCASLATINHFPNQELFPTRDTSSDFSKCPDSHPPVGATSFQHGVDNFLNLEVDVALDRGCHVNFQVQEFSNTSDYPSIGRRCGPVELPYRLSSRSPASNDPRVLDWTDSPCLSTYWDIGSFAFESSGLLSPASFAGDAELCLDFSPLPVEGNLFNQWPLPSNLDNFLSGLNDASEPWNRSYDQCLIPDWLPTASKQSAELELPIPSPILSSTISTHDSSYQYGQSYSDCGGSSPLPLLVNSSEEISATSSSRSVIECTWPRCEKTFSTRPAYT